MQSPSRGFRVRQIMISCLVLLAVVTLGVPIGTGGVGFGQMRQRGNPQNVPLVPGETRTHEDQSPFRAAMIRRQKKALMKQNFEKMKRDSDKLVELSKSLQEYISKSNPDELSIRVIKTARKAEKLAKRIQKEAKGY